MARDWITVVSGLPRSGTSMMMRMLDLGGIPALVDHIRKPDEDNPKGYYEFEPVKKTKDDASWVLDAGGKVVKMVHLLLLDLPADREYRVVFMRRKLEEVVASQNVMLERHGKLDDSLPADRIMTMFETQIAKVKNYVAEHDNFKMIEIQYNDTLTDPTTTAHLVNEFLGGDLNVEAMVGVVDPAMYRQRK